MSLFGGAPLPFEFEALRDGFAMLCAAGGLFALYLAGRCLRHLPDEFFKDEAPEEAP